MTRNRGYMILLIRVKGRFDHFSDYGFLELGLNRIYAEPYFSNSASIRVLEKAGFNFEGRLRSSVIN